MQKGSLFIKDELKDRLRVFSDRTHAGEILAEMLEEFRSLNSLILAIPAGGVPVASRIAELLEIPMDIIPVSKITPIWNTEIGYGAVSFDGTVLLNNELIIKLNLSTEEIERDLKKTREKVYRRMKNLRGKRQFPDLSGKNVIIVDDGLASGYTMKVAVDTVRKRRPARIIIAIPTAHEESLDILLNEVDAIYCANMRGGWHFAVADAYERWCDVNEEEVKDIIQRVILSLQEPE